MEMMRQLVRIMWVPVLLAVLYTGWVFWQRHSEETKPKHVRAEIDVLSKYGDSVRESSDPPADKSLSPYKSSDQEFPSIRQLPLLGVKGWDSHRQAIPASRASARTSLGL